MDNLRNAIRAIFCKFNPDLLLAPPFSHRFENNTSSIKYDSLIEEEFPYLYECLEDNHTFDEIEAIRRLVKENWAVADDGVSPQMEDLDIAIFHLLHHFANQVLLLNTDQLNCKFEELLRWHELTQYMGEDLFTCSFLAKRDIPANRDRIDFNWAPILKTDNPRLNTIFERGLSDLHFHLYGSAFNYDLNWVFLMNNIAGNTKEFKQLTRLRNSNIKHTRGGFESSLHALTVKAAAIRSLLFQWCKRNSVGATYNNNPEKRILDKIYSQDVLFYATDIQSEINELRSIARYHSGIDLADYALEGIPFKSETFPTDRNTTLEYNSDHFFEGERFILYHVMKGIYKQENISSELLKLFHSYILIKNIFRMEMVQVNKRVGFSNFSKYQDRKSSFSKTDFQNQLLTRMAVKKTFDSQSLRYLEARISPENTKSANEKYLESVDKILQTDKDPKYHYIFHFIKKREKSRTNTSDTIFISGSSRDAKLRKEIKKKTLAIQKLRESSSEIRKRLVGIDAASSEIGCRPEIFATAYRYLKEYNGEHPDALLKGEKIAPLGFTFHAGEDFLDLVDGLRAIDETVNFLDFRKGDRLGHALALGTNPEAYYNLKNKQVILCKQDILDNSIWLLHKLHKYGISVPRDLEYKIEQNIESLLLELYDETNKVSYLASYHLHGDDPVLYQSYDTLSQETFDTPAITFWDLQGLCKSKEALSARKKVEARKLYHQYHFDGNCKQKGSKMQEVRIDPRLYPVIQSLQRKMQSELAHLQIAIETNPSSNCVIGAFSRYDEHPIVDFFNKGLNAEPHHLINSAQMSVSINTDDQGVFATLLENEYALMALALQKEKNPDGTPRYHESLIYDWLENIRQMGIEQSFCL